MAKKRRSKRSDQGAGAEKTTRGHHQIETVTNTSAKPALSLRMIMWGGLGVVVASSIGLALLANHSNAQREREMRCSSSRADIERKLKDDELNNIQVHLDDARRYCDPEHHADVDRLAREVAEKQKAARQEVTDNERAATEMWPERAKHLEKWLEEGEKAAAAGRWPDVTATIMRVEFILDGFKGTSVEQSPEWANLMRRLAELKKKVRAQP